MKGKAIVRYEIRAQATAVSLTHDCPVVGDVEMSSDWRLCPWCGAGLVRAIAAAKEAEPRLARMHEAGRPAYDAW